MYTVCKLKIILHNSVFMSFGADYTLTMVLLQ